MTENNNMKDFYEDKILQIINKSDVKVTNLEKLYPPQKGCKGIVYYDNDGKGVPFKAEIYVDDQMVLNFTSRYPFAVNEELREQNERMMIIANSIIEGDGTFLHDPEDDSIYLLCSIPLNVDIIADRLNCTLKTAASIMYAFQNYFFAINSATFKTINYNESVIAKLIMELIYDSSDIDLRDEKCIYRNESWYQYFVNHYDREYLKTKHNLEEYEFRKNCNATKESMRSFLEKTKFSYVGEIKGKSDEGYMLLDFLSGGNHLTLMTMDLQKRKLFIDYHPGIKLFQMNNIQAHRLIEKINCMLNETELLLMDNGVLVFRGSFDINETYPSAKRIKKMYEGHLFVSIVFGSILEECFCYQQPGVDYLDKLKEVTDQLEEHCGVNEEGFYDGNDSEYYDEENDVSEDLYDLDPDDNETFEFNEDDLP